MIGINTPVLVKELNEFIVSGAKLRWILDDILSVKYLTDREVELTLSYKGRTPTAIVISDWQALGISRDHKRKQRELALIERHKQIERWMNK